MPKKSLLLSASFFDCLGKAAVFCVHKLKEKMRDPSSLRYGGTAYAAGPLCRCATSPCVAGRHPARGAVWAGGYGIRPYGNAANWSTGDFMPRLESA